MRRIIPIAVAAFGAMAICSPSFAELIPVNTVNSSTAIQSTKYRKVLVFVGTQTVRTRAFVVQKNSQWLLQWSFDCAGVTDPAFAASGFSGSSHDVAVSVARAGRIKAHGRIPSQQTGVFHYKVTSNCTWRLAIYKAPLPVAPVSSPASNPLTSTAMNAYVSSRSGNITAAIFDVTTGKTYLYRPGVAEQTASIIKVDILATLLQQHQTSTEPLDADDADQANGMIEQSDNDDATALWNAVGGSTGINHFDSLIGLTQTTPNTEGFWGETTTTALDQIDLLKEVALSNSVLDDASRNYELNLMENVIPYDYWGVSSGPTGSATVALKNGWLPLTSDNWQINSIGDIDSPKQHYLIAVLTTGNPTEDYGISTIEKMSAIIWGELTSAS